MKKKKKYLVRPGGIKKTCENSIVLYSLWKAKRTHFIVEQQTRGEKSDNPRLYRNRFGCRKKQGRQKKNCFSSAATFSTVNTHDPQFTSETYLLYLPTSLYHTFFSSSATTFATNHPSLKLTPSLLFKSTVTPTRPSSSFLPAASFNRVIASLNASQVSNDP